MNDYLVIIDQGGEQTRAQASVAAATATSKAAEAAASATVASAKAAEAEDILEQIEQRASASFDGGNARSVYLPSQVYDGGNAHG